MAFAAWEVFMERKTSMNAAQNTRKRRELVQAFTAEEAMKAAEIKRPEFRAVSARRAA